MDTKQMRVLDVLLDRLQRKDRELMRCTRRLGEAHRQLAGKGLPYTWAGALGDRDNRIRKLEAELAQLRKPDIPREVSDADRKRYHLGLTDGPPKGWPNASPGPQADAGGGWTDAMKQVAEANGQLAQKVVDLEAEVDRLKDGLAERTEERRMAEIDNDQLRKERDELKERLIQAHKLAASHEDELRQCREWGDGVAKQHAEALKELENELRRLRLEVGELRMVKTEGSAEHWKEQFELEHKHKQDLLKEVGELRARPTQEMLDKSMRELDAVRGELAAAQNDVEAETESCDEVRAELQQVKGQLGAHKMSLESARTAKSMCEAHLTAMRSFVRRRAPQVLADWDDSATHKAGDITDANHTEEGGE